MRTLLFDTEYNNINSDKATKIWCISAVDVETGEKFKFHPKEEGEDQYHNQFAKEFREFIKDYDRFSGHHFWGAEAVVCKNLLGIEFETDQVIDTLVWSRTMRPSTPYVEKYGELREKGLDNRLGGHSLDAWGKRLGDRKIEFDKFDHFSWEMMEYCDQDVQTNLKLLQYLFKEKEIMNFPDKALEIENESARRLVQQGLDGFTLDKARAKKLIDDTGNLIDEYLNELHKVFPPKKIEVRTFTPRYVTKPRRDEHGKLIKATDGKTNVTEVIMHGQDRNTLIKNMHEKNEDGSYTIFRMQEFNPNSPKQVGERLMGLGWNPRIYTATGQPSTNKNVLGEAIDFLAPKTPEVEVLRKYNIVTHRNSTAKEWLSLSKDDEEGRVHGRVNHVGPWTHRSSHFEPNMANISKVKHGSDGPLKGLAGNFGWDSRHCWIAREGWSLVGCDASGIQLRALAHYMDDPMYIKEVTTGDVHVANQKAALIKDRDTAKTFIYAWLLGAGDEKIGQIVGVTEEEYDSLFERAKATYKWNWFRHNKGRREKRNKYDNLLFWATDKLRSEGRRADRETTAVILKGHFTKKMFLENTPALKVFKEEVIPDAAKAGYMESLDGRKIWVPNAHYAMGAYLQGFEAVIMKWAMILYQDKLREQNIPFVQCAFVHDEFQIETPTEYAEEVGKTVVWSIKEAGNILNSKCPLDGEYKVGTSWAETH